MIMVQIAHDHLETLRRCGGYYSCPKDSNGKRLGPLVGYAGKYVGPDGQQRQWVGDVYCNFAKAEEYPPVLHSFAEDMLNNRAFCGAILMNDIFCGAPIGGYAFSQMLGMVCEHRVIKAEKKVTAVATPTMREQSELVFARHSIETGGRYIIVEDVCNNFPTTEQLIKLICSAGGKVVAIVCLLNRSLAVGDSYHSAAANEEIPMFSLVRLPILEYKQEDPAVAEDIAKGNVILKPKDEWDRLMAAMK